MSEKGKEGIEKRRNGDENNIGLVQNAQTPSEPFETNKELAKRAKTSKDKVKKAKYIKNKIKEKGDKETKKRHFN